MAIGSVFFLVTFCNVSLLIYIFKTFFVPFFDPSFANPVCNLCKMLEAMLETKPIQGVTSWLQNVSWRLAALSNMSLSYKANSL